MSTPSFEVRRALTETEFRALADRIDNAASLSELTDIAVRGLFDTLLADTPRRFADFDDDHRLDPRQFAIPTTQWEALSAAVTSRADQWSAATAILLQLGNIWPSTFDDQAAPVPQLTLTDRRPDQFEIHLSREAADEIANCEVHLSSLANFYGPTSAHYLAALRSWHRLMSGLFATRRGANTTVTRDGHLSLLVICDRLTYAVIFHGRPRTCTDPACHATASNDGTWRKPYGNASIRDHTHTPSYPFDAPQPGDWSAHS